MNALDNLLLIIFAAVLIFYCWKKKKLPFSKLRKGEEKSENTENTADMPAAAGTNNIIPMPAQGMGAFSQIYPYLYAAPAGSAAHAAYCKIIGADNAVIDSDADLERIANTELTKLTAAGFTIQSINAFAYIKADGAGTAHTAFCIAYGR